MTEGAALAAAAERLIGAPYRPGGRDPARGLDCLGVVLASLAAIGRPTRPIATRPRRLGIDDLETAASLAGLAQTHGEVWPGDVLLVRTGPAQPHLLIAASGGSVHAHAALRRVVLTPPPVPWPVERRWRLVSA